MAINDWFRVSMEDVFPAGHTWSVEDQRPAAGTSGGGGRTAVPDAKETEPNPPRTLVEAHEALARIRPPRKAALGQWLSYYQHSAAMYAEIAEIDRCHHHESLSWAEHARNRAEKIKALISDKRTVAIDKEGGNGGGEGAYCASATDVDAGP